MILFRNDPPDEQARHGRPADAFVILRKLAETGATVTLTRGLAEEPLAVGKMSTCFMRFDIGEESFFAHNIAEIHYTGDYATATLVKW